MAGKITDLSAIGSIDRTADLLEIVDVSGNTSNKVTVNNLIGISGGSVLSTTDTQTVQNKTLDNTNTITLKDSLLTLQDNSDITKQAQFQLSGITAGQTRVYTLPDATGTLMDLATAQTATNKTFTAPAINGGTIDNATVTVDAISGHTTPTTGTVYGITVTLGTIGSAALATGAVTASKIGTDASFASTSYVPTITGFTTGTGSVFGNYQQIGKLVTGRAGFVFGASGSAVTGAITISLPVTSVAYTANREYLGSGIAYDDSVAAAAGTFFVAALWASTTTMNVWSQNAASTVLVTSAISSTSPMTWASGDTLSVAFRYEAA